MAKSFLGSIGETLTGETYGQTAQREKLQNERDVKYSTEFIARLSASDAVNTTKQDGTLYSLTDQGFSDIIKFQEVDDGEGGKKRIYPKAALISDILNSSNILKSHTDAETGELKDGKVAGIEENEDGSISIIIDTPQGFFPKTLGMTNDPRDQVLKMSKEEFKGLLDTQIAAGYSRTRGEEMAKGSAIRQGVAGLAAAQNKEMEERAENQIGDVAANIEDGVAAGEIDPLEGARALEEISRDFIKLQKEKKAESTQTQEPPTPPAEEVPTSEGVLLAEDSVLLTARRGGYGVQDSARTQKDLTAIGKEFPSYIAPKKGNFPFNIPQDQWNNLKEADRRFITKRSEQLTKQNIMEATKAARLTFDGSGNTSYGGPGNVTETPPTPSFLTQLSEQEGVSPEEYKEAEKTVDHFKTNKKDIEKYVKENPEALKQYTDSPVSFISAHRKGELPGQKNDGTTTTPPTVETTEKDKEFNIPPMPTNIADLKTWVVQNEENLRALGKDGEIINRVSEAIKKYDIQKPEDLKRMPPLDRKLNVTMVQVAATIAESSIGSSDASFNATFEDMMNLGQTGTVQNNSIQVQELDRRYDLDVAKFGESKAKSRRSASTASSNTQLAWEKFARSVNKEREGFGKAFNDQATTFQKSLVDEDGNWLDPTRDNTANAEFKKMTRMLTNNGAIDNAAIPRKDGVYQFQNLTPEAREAAEAYIGMSFKAYVNTNGSDGLKDWFGDILASNDPNSLTAVLEKVRYRTKVAEINGKKRKVIDEIYFHQYPGGETEGSIKSQKLYTLYGAQFAMERQLLMSFIREDPANDSGK